MFVYLALLTFHPFIPASCGLWGLILVATSRREFTLRQCPTHAFGRKKPSGERVAKLSCLTAGNTYVTEKGAVILLCCAVLCKCSPVPHGCQSPVTIYLPHVRGSQPQARDISLPKLYNVEAMVWRESPRAIHSYESQPAGLPLCNVRFVQVERRLWSLGSANR